MSNAREVILAKLRSARRASVLPVADPYHARITEPLEQFRRGLEKVLASHETLATAEQINTAIEQYLLQHQAENELVVAEAIHKAGLLANSRLRLHAAPATGNELNVITLAYAGIAETGSLVMLSGPDTPVTSNFLPDNFICILKTNAIVPDMETLWSRMKSEQIPMPRSINIITGPSRTADVEQIIQLGAHGPRRVHVILWDSI